MGNRQVRFGEVEEGFAFLLRGDVHQGVELFVLDPAVSKVNIHFNNYINEWEANEGGGLQNDFTDTLFKTEYKTYMESVFNEKQRLTTVTAYLPYKIFSSLKLNNVIELGQNRYFINSMTTDLTNGKTKFELLNNFIPLG